MKAVIGIKDFGLVRLTQIKNFFSDPEKRSHFFEKVGIVLSGGILLFSLYTLVSDRFWPSFIKEFSEGLVRIATITEEKGSSYKKTSVDTLWLPLFSKASVYFGDTIKTSKETSVNVELNPKASFRIEEDSLVRIKLYDGKPMIRLANGTIQTNFLEDQVVLIKRGAKIEEVIIQKGSFLIKNDLSAGIQITQFTQETKKSAGEKEKQQTKAKANKESEDDDKKNGEELPEDDSIAHEEIMQVTYHVPYPEDDTVFLMKSPKDILVAAQIKCPDSCSLKIYRNQKLLTELRSSATEPALTKIPADQAVVGVYEWEFTSETKNHKAKFYIEEYSEDAVSRAIEKGHPIEIP